MKKGKIIKFCAVLMTAVLGMSSFYGCNKKDEKQTINFFNYGENIGDGVLEEFEEKYGIHVNQEVFDTPEEMYTKMSSGAVQYDVVVSIDYLVQRMISEGRLEKIDFDKVPNMSKIENDHLHKSFDPKNEYSVPYMSGTIGIVYNTDYVKEPIDSWSALWDPQYKNNVLLLDGVRDSLGATLKMLGYSVNTTNPDEINEAKEKGGRVIAVGTTSCRVLESIATDDGKVNPYEGDTEIYIYPGYKFKILDGLITNFHLPESTLIMLVSAFAGYDNVMNAYKKAVEDKYRFFSFGDAMFLK